MSLRVIAYGGGVQSTALLVMAARGELGPIDAALFCNVGDDSEHPETLEYVRDVAVPYGAAHGVPVLVLDRVRRDGSTETLWQRLMREGSRSLPIPVRMSNGAPGTRSCTVDFKIKVMAKWLKAHGAKAADPADVIIGISWDEAHRAERRQVNAYERVSYPLVERTLSRLDCQRIIDGAGIAIPGKSSCFFCPFHCHSAWTNLKRREPLLFDKAVLLERTLNERRVLLERDPVYLTRFAKPLDTVVDDSQLDLFDVADSCPSGHCWT
jgi:hypothetical protein